MKRLSFLCVAALLPLILSCKTTTAPNVGTADVMGRAELQSTTALLTSSRGITVTVENTLFSAFTDDSGMYEFKGIPEGTYNIRFSKAGFGDVYWYGKSIQGGGNAPIYWTENTPYNFNGGTVWLTQRPNVGTTLQSARYVDSGQGSTTYQVLKLTGSYFGNDTNSVVIFFSHHSNVSSTPGTYDYYTIPYCNASYGLNVYPGVVTSTSNSKTFESWIQPAALRDFHSGDSVYVACYACTSWLYQGLNSTCAGDYYDPIHRVWVLTCIDQTPSPAIGLKIP
jgi:hypothetical protein